MKVEFGRVRAGATLPRRMSAQAAGLDLAACLDQPLELSPGARAVVPTGLWMRLPEGFEGQVRPRSGLALRHGVTVLNAPGTIDADYRGEIGVLLVNLSREPFAVRHGDRVAQLVVAPVVMVDPVEAEGDPEVTSRGSGGYGSTGGLSG